MRIAHNYNLHYIQFMTRRAKFFFSMVEKKFFFLYGTICVHREKKLCTSCHKLNVVGSCSQGIQDKVYWQCLFCLISQQHCWSYFTFRVELSLFGEREEFQRREKNSNCKNARAPKNRQGYRVVAP